DGHGAFLLRCGREELPSGNRAADQDEDRRDRGSSLSLYGRDAAGAAGAAGRWAPGRSLAPGRLLVGASGGRRRQRTRTAAAERPGSGTGSESGFEGGRPRLAASGTAGCAPFFGE